MTDNDYDRQNHDNFSENQPLEEPNSKLFEWPNAKQPNLN
jgi:hypothetical protein